MSVRLELSAFRIAEVIFQIVDGGEQPGPFQAYRTRSTLPELNEEVAILDPLAIDAAVTFFARYVARKSCYSHVSLAKTPDFSTTFLSTNPRWVTLVSARIRAPMSSCQVTRSSWISSLILILTRRRFADCDEK